MNLRRLAIVLKHANSSPPSEAREGFYTLKQAILERYGSLVGEDLQEIVDRCWGYRYEPCDEDCEKCGGTGIYHRRLIRLQRWELAGLIFHRPIERSNLAFPPREPDIRGRIQHRFSKMAFASWRVLTLVFHPAFYLYLDQFRMNEKQLRRFKATLAYLMEFPRSRWQHRALKFDEIKEMSVPF